jgi:hypothetical protein
MPTRVFATIESPRALGRPAQEPATTAIVCNFPVAQNQGAPFALPIIARLIANSARFPCKFHNVQTIRGTTMTSPMYTNSVPVFRQFLTALKAILAQAAAHAAAKSIEPDALLQSRLYPDMFPLVKQVQIAADFSRGVTARLAGVDVPSYEGKETSFADLDALLARTLEFIDGVKSAQLEGSETKEIVLRPGTPKEKKLSGQAYLVNYGLPQFFFHATTAYNILRHNGLAIGKRDYMGQY